MKKGTTLRGEIQRIQNIPQQYQRGYCEFYKLRFKLTPDVLIPRPETELLVDEVIKLDPKTVIDIGTGSGCIAISIAKNIPQAKVLAVDISEKALDVAKQNAKLHHVENQVVFLQNDLLTAFHPAFHPRGGKLKPDVIVANLPYIPTAKLLHIVDPLVRDFEPREALDGGQDGFEVYRRLFSQIRDQQIYPKVMLCEIEETQKETALAEAKKYFPNASWEVKKDLAKKDRILIVTF